MNNSIIPILNELGNGHAVIELSETLNAAVASVGELNKSAEITLKIKIKPRNGGKTVDVEHAITSKLPKAPPAPTFFYVNADNGLQRNDPDQRTFDLKEVPKDEPIRELPAEPAAVNQ